MLPSLQVTGFENIEKRSLYQSWLGTTQEQDAKDCLLVLNAEGISSIDWIIVDHYGLGEEWEVNVSSSINSGYQPRVMIIDDLADRTHMADIIIDQNYLGEDASARYNSLVPKTCKQLLGPKFAILSPEYSYLHQCIPIRKN